MVNEFVRDWLVLKYESLPDGRRLPPTRFLGWSPTDCYVVGTFLSQLAALVAQATIEYLCSQRRRPSYRRWRIPTGRLEKFLHNLPRLHTSHTSSRTHQTLWIPSRASQLDYGTGSQPGLHNGAVTTALEWVGHAVGDPEDHHLSRNHR